MVSLIKRRSSVFVQREAAGGDIEAPEPVPQADEVDLHLLIEGLAGRVDIGPAIRLYVQEVLRVEEREAKDVILRPLPDGSIISRTTIAV